MDQLGALLEGARTRLALSQGAVASLLEVSQQTVSSWEKGLSRPRSGKREQLAALLNLSADEIAIAVAATRAASADAEHLAPEAMPLPVRPLTPLLPLNGLSSDGFERFIADLFDRLYPDSEVSQLGGQGDDQRGYDILVETNDGRRVGVQCKREQTFGPAKVTKAVSVAELDVDESVIALGRPATAEARLEIDKHTGWRLWDQADLSRKIRQLPSESALQLVRTHFPSHVEAFLGIKPANPWMTAEEFYRSSAHTLLDHRQALVGRRALVDDIAEWVSGPMSSDIAVLVGRGGLGKSKLLWEVSTRAYPGDVHFRFLAIGQQPDPADFEVLPRTGQIIVVLDDAHAIDRVAAVVAQLWQLRPGSRVLLATRPYGEIQLDTEVWKLNQSPRSVKRWALEDLTQTEAGELVSALIGRPVTDPFTRQLTGISADCPFLAVVAADLLRRGELAGTSLASDAALRDEVFRRFADQMTGGMTGSDAAERRAVLSALAAFQPVRLDDSDFVSAITFVTKIESWDAINGRIHELEDAGLVLRRGTNAVRVVPDMFGDVLLGQAAYDARSGRATSFMTRAQEAAKATPLQHLLVNASRMDWQVRDGGPARADIVGGLWSTLRTELLAGTFEEQLSLLKLVAKIAYYQPELALGLVKDVLAIDLADDAAGETEEPKWVTTRLDVIRATTPVLRNVAYHLASLRPALEILWSLAQEDERPTNQHPDHPLRVLRQIADLSTGKPFIYIDAVVDLAVEWLASPTRLSPFDVIEPILAVEGTDETSSDLTLTFRAFGIDPDSVRIVRDRVVNLAFQEAISDDVPAAVRAIQALEHAIRGPIGMFSREPSDSEREAWAREFVPIIERLGALGTDPDRDPAIRVAIRHALSWHAEHSETATKPAAEAALASLVRTPEDDLALCLHDGWGHMAMNTGLNFEDAERALLAEFRRVAELISVDQTDQQTLDHLEDRLHIEHMTSTGFESSGRFVTDFFTFRPSAAAALCEAVPAGHFPELRHFVAPALAVLANEGDARAVGFATAMLAGDDLRLQAAAAFAFSWNRAGRAVSLPGEAEVLTTMATHKNDVVRGAAGQAVYAIALTDKALALDLLAKIRFGGSAKVAGEALRGFAAQGPLWWAETNEIFRQAILAQLVECDALDEYPLTSAISELSLIDPVRVTKFLIARIDRQAELRDFGYDALPYRWEPKLRIQESRYLARCLAEVREWMTTRSHDRSNEYLQDDGSDLYKLVAGDWNEQAFLMLNDLGETSTESALITVARILAHAPIAVLLKQVDLVTKVLRRSAALGKEPSELVAQALMPTNSGVFTTWSGERPTKDVQERDDARKIAAGLPRGSIEGRFFNALADAIEARLNWTMSRPEPRFDGRDW
jgi:transcriptional regulator with XRE-family HTH domain